MRALNFRDNVLYPLAFKLGRDPADGYFLTNGALALVSFINAWVRRLMRAMDSPEWTIIAGFVPYNHIVPYSSLTVPDGVAAEIDRVFKVYLLDPRSTVGDGLDTPFKKLAEGVHVGFEHGPQVWLKYQEPPPQFTGELWNAQRIYNLGELTYSPVTGECYKSIITNNVGNDPSSVENWRIKQPVPPNPGGGGPPPPLPPPPWKPMTVETTQPWQSGTPGVDTTMKIMDILFNNIMSDPGLGGNTYVSIYSDTPPVTPVSSVTYSSVAGASAQSIRDGVLALLQANAALSTYQFAALSSPLRIRVKKLENFSIYPQPFFQIGISHVKFNMAVQQIQGFTAAVTAIDSQRPYVKVNLANDQVSPGNQYVFRFSDTNARWHTVTYIALSADGPAQILFGIANAIMAAAEGDDFFTDMQTVVDTVGQSLTLSQGLPFGIDAIMMPSKPPAWQLVPFPAELVDEVVRGAYADELKTEGQADKAASEEQAVPQEMAAVAGRNSPEQYDRLSDQQDPAKSRYAVK